MMAASVKPVESATTTEKHVEKPATMPGRNGGTLRRGGTSKGGPGRPPSEIRAKLREDFYGNLPILDGIAKDPNAKIRDRLEAIRTQGAFGVGTKAEVAAEVNHTAEVKRFVLPELPAGNE